MKHNDQRVIIEQLLGITLLSEKSDQLKEQLRINKDMITQEEYKIKSVQDANEKIRDQIEALKRRSKMWSDKKDQETVDLQQALDSLTHVDIEQELKAHSLRKDYKDKKREIKELNDTIERIQSETKRNIKSVEKLEKELKLLEDHKCYACGQELHDNKQEEILKDKKELLKESTEVVENNNTEEQNLNTKLQSIGELGDEPKVLSLIHI